jgi:hypothetical protein
MLSKLFNDLYFVLPIYVQQHDCQTLALQLIIIALFALVTGLFFLWLQRISNRNRQIMLLLGFFTGSSIVVAFMELISIYPDFYNLGHLEGLLLVFLCLSLFFDYASGMAAIILPTYFVAFQIRERKQWKIVSLCFVLTVTLQNIIGYLLGQTSFYDGIWSILNHTIGIEQIYFAHTFVQLIQVSTTLILAFVSYWIIIRLIRRFPRFKQILA